MPALRAKSLRLTPYLAGLHRCGRWRGDRHAARARGARRPAEPAAAGRPRPAGSPRGRRGRGRLPRARHHPGRPGPDVQLVPRRLAIRPGPRGDGVTTILANHIDGRATEPLDGTYLDDIDPATGAVHARVPASEAADVELAVAAAQRAFPGWSATPAAERSRILLRLADALESRPRGVRPRREHRHRQAGPLARSLDIPRAVGQLALLRHGHPAHRHRTCSRPTIAPSTTRCASRAASPG